jgi:Putative phage metallopeptidase
MPKDYVDAESVEALAQQILPTFHAELADAKIKYYFVSEHSMKGGRAIAGKARKLSGAAQFLAGGFNFAIEVAMDLWNNMSEAEKRASIDHLLEYCTGEEDEENGEMKWTMREPDVKEFSTILRRHGAYNPDLVGLVQVAQGITIDARVQEIVDEAAAEDVQVTN